MTGQEAMKNVLSLRKTGDGAINFEGMPEYLYCPHNEELMKRSGYFKNFKKKAKYH
jgi:hypothetical protein